MIPGPIEPNGCRWCGASMRSHGQRWAPGQGFHTWQAPTDQQRKERMQEQSDAATAALSEALRRDGFTDPLPLPGSRWEDTTAHRWLPEGHTRQVCVRSVGKTVTGWQTAVRAFELDADSKPTAAYGDKGLSGVLYLETLVAGYRCLQEAQ